MRRPPNSSTSSARAASSKRRRLDAWTAARVPLPDGADAVADALVADGLLTKFHAKHLLAGRARGFVLGPYRVLDQIGAGGMGVVFLAEHATLKRKVAIKVLPQQRAKDAELLERFYREARIVATLDHPNVVRAYDASAAGNAHFLVMEYVPGENLEAVVRKRGPLPPGEAASLIVQAAHGLQHAHDKGLVHRDIKPGNLLLAPDGQVKVLDLGLARFFAADAPDDNLTRNLGDGAVLGTADYIAPEQALDSHDVDGRADMYSLGATFYFLLAGKAPFAASTTTQKLLAHQIKEPPSLTTMKRDLAAVVRMMMAKKPEDRYQTMAELIAALEPFADRFVPAAPTQRLRHETLATIPAPDLEVVEPKPKKPAKKHEGGSSNGVIAAAGVGTLAAIIAILYFAFRGPGKTDGPPAAGPPPAAPATPVLDSTWTEVGGNVHRLALAPDGKTLMTAAGDGDVRLWDVATGLVKHGLPGHVGEVRALAFSPAGTRAASAGYDGTVRLWNVADGKPVAVGKDDDGVQYWSVDFLPDGNLAVATQAGDVRHWQAEPAQRLRVTPVHAKESNWLAVPPAGRIVATAGWDGLVRWTDPADGTAVGDYDFKSPARALAYSPDGRTLAVGGDGGSVALVDPATGIELTRFGDPSHGSTYAMAWSADGRRLAAGGSQKVVRVWDAATGRLAHALPARDGLVSGLAFLPDGRLAAAAFDDAVQFWKLPPPEPLRVGEILRYPAPDKVSAERLALSPNGNLLAVGFANGATRVYAAASGRLASELKPDGEAKVVRFASFAPDGRRLVTTGEGGIVRVWDVVKGTELLNFAGHAGSKMAWAAAFSPDGKQVASADEDGTVLVWDAAGGTVAYRPEKHERTVNWLAWHPKGTMLYTGGWDGVVKGFKPGDETPAFRQEPDGPKGRSSVVVPSPDGNRLLVGLNGRTIVCDGATGERVGDLEAKGPNLWCLAYSPDGRRVLGGGGDTRVRLWNLADGTPGETIGLHDKGVTGSAIMADGVRGVTCSHDGTVRQWRLK